jgi:DNA processing protein
MTAALLDPRLPLRAHGSWTGLPLDQLDAERERSYWIVTAQLAGIGPVTVGRLLASAGSLRAAWQGGLVDRVAADLPVDARRDTLEHIRFIRARGLHRVAVELVARGRAQGIRAVTAIEPAYPPALTTVDPRPPVLWMLGDAQAWQAAGVAVVGTRRPSGYGRAATEEISDALARAGVSVVSGLAIGIDAVAHEAAVAANGRTIAVLPSPIDRLYPPVHRGLATRIVRAGGALVTELPPGRNPGKPDFARRNRIIASMSEAVVVVEAPDKSGALLTADAAIGLGRELFAVPGPMDAATSRGPNRLIADHAATLVTSPAALLHLIGLNHGHRAVSVRSLSDTEGLLLGTLLNRSGSIEELGDRLKLPTSLLAATLTMLEARGLVTAYSGATFHPTLAARKSGYPKTHSQRLQGA